jgi:hypothetical protein
MSVAPIHSKNPKTRRVEMSVAPIHSKNPKTRRVEMSVAPIYPKIQRPVGLKPSAKPIAIVQNGNLTPFTFSYLHIGILFDTYARAVL